MFSTPLFKRILVACSFILLFCSNVKAQTPELFSFTNPDTVVKNSLYNTLTLIDARVDTSNLGEMNFKFNGKKVKIIATPSLKAQFDNIIAALVDNTAKPNELTLRIRRLSFAETTNNWNETGYFNFKAELFGKVNNLYKKIAYIDTLAKASAMDVKKPLLIKLGSDVVSSFLSNNLQKEALGDTTYNYTEILKVDSIEKSKIKAFNTATYTDGLYFTYKSFADQLPDAQIKVEGDTLEKNNVKMVSDGNKLKKIKTGSYALVYKGKPYIIMSSGYQAISKVNNDLVFIGTTDSKSPNAGLSAVGGQYGLIGAALTGLIIAGTTEKGATYEMKIDHTTGQFILLKKIDK